MNRPSLDTAIVRVALRHEETLRRLAACPVGEPARDPKLRHLMKETPMLDVTDDRIFAGICRGGKLDSFELYLDWDDPVRGVTEPSAHSMRFAKMPVKIYDCKNDNCGLMLTREQLTRLRDRITDALDEDAT